MISAATNYKQIQWDGFVVLDRQGTTLDKCIQSLNLDDFDLMGISEPRSADAVANIDAFISRGFSQNLAPLLMSCVYGEQCADHIERVRDYFLRKVKPLYPAAGLVTYASEHTHRKNTHFQVHVPSGNLLEFDRKVARHLELLMDEQPSGSPLKPIGPKFSSQVVDVDGLNDIEVLVDQPYMLRVRLDGVPFEMYCHFRSDSDNLVVFGQDALTRSRVRLPHFFRWKWLTDLPFSGVVLNDPTLYLADDLNGGWFVGTRARDYAQECAQIIGRLQEKLALQRPITFFGASAGGFTAMALASCLPGARAIADIPQVDLTTYHAKAEVDRLASAAFSVDDITHVPPELAYRVQVIKRFEHQQRIPEVLYLHNVRDAAHVSQFNGFLAGWSALAHTLNQADVGCLSVCTYSRWHLTKGGHFPLSKSEMLKKLQAFVEGGR